MKLRSRSYECKAELHAWPSQDGDLLYRLYSILSTDSGHICAPEFSQTKNSLAARLTNIYGPTRKTGNLGLRNSRTAFNAVIALETVCGATDTQGSLRYIENTPAH